MPSRLLSPSAEAISAGLSSAARAKLALLQPLAFMTSSKVSRLPEPGDEVALFCDDMFTSLQCEEVTRTKVGWITLYSVPTPLAVVEPATSVGGWPVRLPKTLAPGRHDVVFEGASEAGEPVYAVGQIVIHPEGTRASLVMTGAGFVLVVAGAAFWLRHSVSGSFGRGGRPTGPKS